MKPNDFAHVLPEALIGFILAVGCFWFSGVIIDNMLVKGNGSSMTYHLPGCASYESTVIGNDRDDRWFITPAQAEVAGYEKATNCHAFNK